MIKCICALIKLNTSALNDKGLKGITLNCILIIKKKAPPQLGGGAAESVVGDTLHLNPVDSWLDLLKTWGRRKSHAGSKIDLGLHSEEKMKDIQSYRPPSHVSV